MCHDQEPELLDGATLVHACFLLIQLSATGVVSLPLYKGGLQLGRLWPGVSGQVLLHTQSRGSLATSSPSETLLLALVTDAA